MPPEDKVPQPAAAPELRTRKAEKLPAPVWHEHAGTKFDLARSDHVTKHLQRIGQEYGGRIDTGMATTGFAEMTAKIEALLKLLKRQ